MSLLTVSVCSFLRQACGVANQWASHCGAMHWPAPWLCKQAAVFLGLSVIALTVIERFAPQSIMLSCCACKLPEELLRDASLCTSVACKDTGFVSSLGCYSKLWLLRKKKALSTLFCLPVAKGACCTLLQRCLGLCWSWLYRSFHPRLHMRQSLAGVDVSSHC